MAVLDLVACPICRARDSLVRRTTQLESRTHVTYECQQCGTLLVWLGDEMWLEADRWSFQKVGLPERADLLYRSMTVGELRKLAGETAPFKAPLKRESEQAIPPPVWIEMPPAAEEPLEELQPETFEEEPAREQPLPARMEAATLAAMPVPVEPAPTEPEVEEAEPEQEARPAVDQELPREASAGVTVVRAAPPSEAETMPVAERPAAEPGPPAGVSAAPAAAQQPDVVQAAAQESPSEVRTDGSGAETAARGHQAAAPVAERQAKAEPEVPAESALEAVLVASAQAAVTEVQSLPDAAKVPGPGDAPELRGTRPRRRSRGSPFLVISVGLVLLCLICSAAAMVIYSMWERLPENVEPTAVPPATEMQPADTTAPTDTPFPTATPTPEPTATPPEEAGGVEFQGVTDYVSSSGSHYLVGEVLNRTGDTLRFVEVLATFYDAGGQLVGTGSTFTELSIIEPGTTAPFKMTTLNPPSVGRYDLRIDYSTTTQSPIRLELMSHSGSTEEDGWYHVTGEARNPHDFAVKFPEIVATYYNAAHEVVRVEVDFAEVNPLEPGQSSAFDVVLTDPPADLLHYALQTEAVQQ